MIIPDFSNSTHVTRFLSEQFYNTEAKIWCEIFQKSTPQQNLKKLDFEWGIIFVVGVGWEFEKIWIEIKNIRALKSLKKSVLE